MAEYVTGSSLRARADGLNAVIQGDASTFSREALVTIVDEIRKDLAAAANTLEAHEELRRKAEQPQHNGAGSGDPNPGGAPRDLGTEPRAVNAAEYSPHAEPSSAEPSSVEPSPPDARREAAHDRTARGKDKVEK